MFRMALFLCLCTTFSHHTNVLLTYVRPSFFIVDVKLVGIDITFDLSQKVEKDIIDFRCGLSKYLI